MLRQPRRPRPNCYEQMHDKEPEFFCLDEHPRTRLNERPDICNPQVTATFHGADV
jgi:hypothetical protein